LTSGVVQTHLNHKKPVVEPLPHFGTDVQAAADEDLLRLCAQGDDTALRELTRRHQGMIYGFLTRFLGTTEDAEQATLNVFVKVWQNAAKFQYRAGVATWLFRIAVNVAHDAHKRRSRRPEQTPWPEEHQWGQFAMGDAQEDAQQRLEQQERARSLQHVLNQLRDEDRLVLVLYYYEERTYEEIQAITQLSNPVLKTRLTRARQRLRKLLDAENH
jgi:RNA polymerase sigma-70 factor (ECF subfamily)